MKRRMEQLINGRFEYEAPKLVLSRQEIREKTALGENYRGELCFGAEDNQRIKGMINATNRRILLDKDKFSGEAIHLSLGVDVKGLSADSICTGEIVISSNIGEYRVPVSVQVEGKQITTSQGRIRTLTEFVHLAQKDYREAFRLFTSDSFVGLLKDRDRKYQSLYRGMSQNPVTYQHMEEFLIGAGKKEPMSLSLDKQEREMLKLKNSQKDSVYLYKNTWGYLRLEVEVVGDFLEVEKKVITSEDFIGSVYGLEYIVRRDRLGQGKKYGKIRLKHVYGTLEFLVTASAENDYQLNMRGLEKKKKFQMTRDYLELSMHRMDYRTWEQNTRAVLGELMDAGCYEMEHQLWQAYLEYSAERNQQARELLEPLKKRVFNPKEEELEGTYLFLAGELGMLEEGVSAPERIELLYKRRPDSILLLMLLLRTREELLSSPIKQLYLMEKQFEIGGTSPFLYQQACQVLHEDESLLRKLTPFLIQTLQFARKKGLLTEGIVKRTAHLSTYLKQYDQRVYQILSAGYEIFGGTDVLDAICKLIMKGKPGKKEYFRWYSRAVEEKLRITRLYEYYIETMDEGYREILPRVIRMYFAYNNTLSSRKKAMVYANVICNKNEDKATYQSYREAMETFAREQLQKGVINENYAVIYQEFIRELKDQAEGEAMAKLLFVNRLYCDDPKVRRVIVCHGALEQEQAVPCVEGVAYVSIYTRDAQILFEDEKRRRYVATIDYNYQPLLDNRELVKQCVRLGVEDPGLLLHVCRTDLDDTAVTEGNLNCFQQITESTAFREEYKLRVRKKLLEYYGTHGDDHTLDGCMRRLKVEEFVQVDRVELIRILVDRGMYQKAFSLGCRYGFEGCEDVTLLKLCSRMIVEQEYVEQEELLALAASVFFRGKYDEVILTYLRENYLGSVESMMQVRRGLEGFNMDSYVLDEEILSLSMFTRVYLKDSTDVLADYMKGGGKEKVILAYVTFLAYGWFLGDRPMEKLAVTWLKNRLIRGGEMDFICHLAYLKDLACQGSLTEEQEQQARELLEQCQQQGLRFAFFQQLPQRLLKPYQLEDKLFVEARFHPKAKVVLHYCLHDSSQEVSRFISEPVKGVYQGIVSKEFLLFYGEALTWYFTVEQGKETIRTETQTVSRTEVDTGGNSKYQLLNQMLAAGRLSREELLRQAAKQYLYQEKLSEQVFCIME